MSAKGVSWRAVAADEDTDEPVVLTVCVDYLNPNYVYFNTSDRNLAVPLADARAIARFILRNTKGSR